MTDIMGLPARYARITRQITITALFFDAFALVVIFLANQLGLAAFAISFGSAVLALILSIVGIVVSTRCLSPRPRGAIGTLLLSIAIIGGYFYLGAVLQDLINQHR